MEFSGNVKLHIDYMRVTYENKVAAHKHWTQLTIRLICEKHEERITFERIQEHTANNKFCKTKKINDDSAITNKKTERVHEVCI